jgi:hypothetical protein
MAVDYRPGWDGHDARRKIGLLTEADLVGQRLVVRGYLYARDFPEVANAIKAQGHEAMGMSYELADARVGGFAGRSVEADPGHLYRRGHPAAREGRLPGDQLSHGELALVSYQPTAGRSSLLPHNR